MVIQEDTRIYTGSGRSEAYYHTSSSCCLCILHWIVVGDTNERERDERPKSLRSVGGKCICGSRCSSCLDCPRLVRTVAGENYSEFLPASFPAVRACLCAPLRWSSDRSGARSSVRSLVIRPSLSRSPSSLYTIERRTEYNMKNHQSGPILTTRSESINRLS